MQTISKIFNFLLSVIFYPFAAVTLVVTILFFCGIRPYITLSGSMEPEIETGSVCFVDTKAIYSNVVPGDIISFELPTGSLVTHRVIAVTEEGLETKGDANDVSDGISTTSENFRGKTLFSIPYVGYILQTMKQPRNIFITMFIILTLVLLTFICNPAPKKDGASSK